MGDDSATGELERFATSYRDEELVFHRAAVALRRVPAYPIAQHADLPPGLEKSILQQAAIKPPGK
jgi:hypothetical protein